MDTFSLHIENQLNPTWGTESGIFTSTNPLHNALSSRRLDYMAWRALDNVWRTDGEISSWKINTLAVKTNRRSKSTLKLRN